MIAKALVVGSLLGALLQPAPNPIAWSFKPPPQKPLGRGETVALRLVADIQPGWHLYSIDQQEGGPIATEISMPPGQPFAFAGAIVGPKPHVIFDQTFGMRVQLYTEKAEFTLPIKIAANAPAGTRTLGVEARYQTCNDTICLPPRTTKVTVPIQVRER